MHRCAALLWGVWRKHYRRERERRLSANGRQTETEDRCPPVGRVCEGRWRWRRGFRVFWLSWRRRRRCVHGGLGSRVLGLSANSVLRTGGKLSRIESRESKPKATCARGGGDGGGVGFSGWRRRRRCVHEAMHERAQWGVHRAFRESGTGRMCLRGECMCCVCVCVFVCVGGLIADSGCGPCRPHVWACARGGGGGVAGVDIRRGGAGNLRMKLPCVRNKTAPCAPRSCQRQRRRPWSGGGCR